MEFCWSLPFFFILISLSLFQIRGVSSLNCFQCNSVTDLDCPYIKPNQTSSIYYKPCVGDFKGKTPFCRKIEQKIFDRDDMVRVVRKCGWERHEKYDCYTMSNDDHTETICQCFHDACNSATMTSSVYYSLFAVFLAPSITSLVWR